MNYIASVIESVEEREHNIVIRSLVDLLSILKRDAPGEWIYRGQASCKWSLLAGVFRNRVDKSVCEISPNVEKRMVAEFRRRARPFLPNPPNSPWEWLTLAQHFGLPTR